MTLNTNDQRSKLSKVSSSGVVAQISDAASFWGVILVSAAAIAAIALATPFVLVVAAVAGLVAGNKRHSTWRPARA